MPGDIADRNSPLPISRSMHSLWPSSGSIKTPRDASVQDLVRTKENRPTRPKQEDHLAGNCPTRLLSPVPNLNPKVLRARPSIDSTGFPKLTLSSSNVGSSGKTENIRRKSVHKRVMSRVKEGILNRSKSAIKLPEPAEAHRCVIDTMADQASSKLHRNTSGSSRHSLALETWSRPAMQPSRLNPSSGNLSMSMFKIDKGVGGAQNDTPRPELNVKGVIRRQDPLVRSAIPSAIIKSNSMTHPSQPAAPIVDPAFLEIVIRTTSRHIGPEDSFPTWVAVTARVKGTAGVLSDVRLSAEAGMDGNIHDILGPQNVTTLYRGETLELRVKLSSQINKRQEYRRVSEQSATIDKLYDELACMLGDGLLELLVVKARYGHSLFSKDTVLTTEQVFKTRLQKDMIQQNTGPINSRGPEAGSKAQYEAASTNQSSDHSPASPTTSSSTSLVITTNLPGLNSEQTPSPDAARKVWHHIRRDSKSPAWFEAFDQSPVDECQDEDVVVSTMRKKALENKRSIGAETIKDWRSLSQSERQDASSTAAQMSGEYPWLL